MIRKPGLFFALLAIFALPLAAEEEAPRMSAGTFEGLEWRGIGPALMSGRIADIAIHPEHQNTWYVAVGSGGVFIRSDSRTSCRRCARGIRGIIPTGSPPFGCLAISKQRCAPLYFHLCEESDRGSRSVI